MQPIWHLTFPVRNDKYPKDAPRRFYLSVISALRQNDFMR